MAEDVLIPANALALMPRVVTKRDVIRSVLARYAEQYPDRAHTVIAGKVGDIHDALGALDLDNATEADVAAIIGNDSWTRLECDICCQGREEVVQVFREYGGPNCVCGLCAAAITSMLTAREKSNG